MTEPMQPQKKKGLHPLAWVAIGCAGLLVVGGVVFFVGGMFLFKKVKDVAKDFEENPAKATAEMVVKINPEIEMVDSDDAAGTMTIRNKKTGEIVTLDFDDIAEGRFSFETEDGTVNIQADGDEDSGGLRISSPDGEVRIGGGSDVELPDWVPRYPGSSPQGTFTSSSDQGVSGMASFEIDDSAEDVLGFYEQRLRSSGYEVTRQTLSAEGTSAGFYGNVTGTQTSGRNVNVSVASGDNGKTTVTVVYSSGG